MKSRPVSEFKDTEIGKIPVDWEVFKLQDHLIIKGRIGWKGLKTSEYTDSGPFIVGGLQIIDNKVSWDKCAHVVEERYNESPEIMLQESDILMTKDGTIGKLAFIENIKCKATVASHIHVIRKNSDKIIPLFLFYFFKSRRFQNLIQSKITGSVVPALTQKDINNTLFPIPPINEQKNISEFLYSLYKKIENLQNQNKILEEMAQAIFKSWFVDFDGVTEFEDSELGKIPKGWSVENMGKLIQFIKGKKPFKTSIGFKENFLPQILIETLNGKSPLFCNPDKMVIVNEFESIMVMDGASSGRIEIGHRGVIGSTLAKIIPQKIITDIPNIYIHYFLKMHEKDINKNTTGTSIPHVDKGKVIGLNVIIPDKNTMCIFKKTTLIIVQKIIYNKTEIKTLILIRDRILPKLMSGEIRV